MIRIHDIHEEHIRKWDSTCLLHNKISSKINAHLTLLDFAYICMHINKKPTTKCTLSNITFLSFKIFFHFQGLPVICCPKKAIYLIHFMIPYTKT